mmetsp:Transcript_2909/g.8104  ORF Transcript_2909/g.8104 Transcript_2909/m.8104 type:complete len:214 (-) Transcript_2909:741-1382(-)
MAVVPESIMAKDEQAARLQQHGDMWLVLARVATGDVVLGVPLHAVLRARARVEGEDAGRTEAEDGHLGVVHWPVAVREDTLPRSVAVDPNAVHGVQCPVKDTQVVQGVRETLLRIRQRHAHEAAAATAAIACAPFLRGACPHVLPCFHVSIRDSHELGLLLWLNPARDVIHSVHIPDPVWCEAVIWRCPLQRCRGCRVEGGHQCVPRARRHSG